MSDTSKVTLSRPVRIDGKDVTEITLREPSAGELRGLQLTQLFQGSVSQLIKLVPRISTPPLSEDQVAGLRMRDITALLGGVMGFLNDGETAAPEMPE